MSYAMEMYVEELGHDGWEYAGACATYEGDGGPGVPDTRPDPFYWTGDYDVMAILAGFRNGGPGWAGPFALVAPPRGLPADLSPELAAWTAYTPPEEDLFPVGWLTLAELLAFEWEGRYNRWDAGPGEEDREEKREEVSYAQIAREILDHVVRRLARRGADHTRVRIVFWIC